MSSGRTAPGLGTRRTALVGRPSSGRGNGTRSPRAGHLPAHQTWTPPPPKLALATGVWGGCGGRCGASSRVPFAPMKATRREPFASSQDRVPFAPESRRPSAVRLVSCGLVHHPGTCRSSRASLTKGVGATGCVLVVYDTFSCACGAGGGRLPLTCLRHNEELRVQLDAATQQGAWGSDRGQRYMGAILDREACHAGLLEYWATSLKKTGC